MKTAIKTISGWVIAAIAIVVISAFLSISGQCAYPSPVTNVPHSWQGTGGKNTEPFTITKSPWVISWSCQRIDPDHHITLGVIICDPATNGTVEVPINTESDTGECYIYQTGKFYLRILSVNANWNVEIK